VEINGRNVEAGVGSRVGDAESCDDLCFDESTVADSASMPCSLAVNGLKSSLCSSRADAVARAICLTPHGSAMYSTANFAPRGFFDHDFLKICALGLLLQMTSTGVKLV
jgi:predicted RNase H-like nuclease